MAKKQKTKDKPNPEDASVKPEEVIDGEENQEDVLDLYLMSKIHNNIIANSSFSWWGAWLSELEDKRVLTPPVWFGPKNTHLTMKDLIPDSWEMVE